MRHSYIAALIVCLALPAAADQVQDLISGKIKACQGCDLSGANFKKADLSGVDLTGAILTDAGFHRANLRGAILDGVVAIGTNFNMADLTQAHMIKGNFTR
eukprot:gene3653-4836_t